MVTALTASAVVLLIGFPGLKLPWKANRPVPTAADSLPPPWKSASRLSLENQFVLGRIPVIGGPSGIRLLNDPRQLRVTLDPDSGTVTLISEVGEVGLGMRARRDLSSYASEASRLSFERQWSERSRTQVNSLGSATPAPGTQRTGLSFALPSPLPRRVQSLLGPGGPALNVSGSESIKLSGQSNWSNQQTGPLGQRRSLFPSLDMQQDLNITLEGQLSDRVRVNLLQNSANQIPLANRIAINYKGDEDDLIQALDLGNTNLTLPGTQYVSYSGRNEGLFGVKAATRIGPLDMTLLASKQEGRSERAQYAGGASRQTQTLRDYDYVKGVYYFLYDPNDARFPAGLEIPDASIRLFKDDANYGNDVNTVRGRALIDPTTVDSASVRGTFNELQPGAEGDYEILHDVYSTQWKVIRLKQPVVGEQRLAVVYQARPFGPDGVGVGELVRVGGQTEVETDGAESLRMKLLRAPASLVRPGTDGFFDDVSGFNPTRVLELKNFYQLAGQRIDPGALEIVVRRGDDEPPVTFVRTRGDTAVPYMEVFGLDNYDETTGRPVRGHDGRVDGTAATSSARLFIDYENGTLFFFDPQPFAPRFDRPFDAFIAGLLNRRAVLDGSLGPENAPNRAIYDKYLVQREDAVYRIDVSFTAQRAAGTITLGRSNIIEGSDVVTINGQALARDRDYTIDYDLGTVTLKRQLGPSDNLNVDYSYAPLFQQAGRTLIGSAFRLEGRDRSLGGAFLYESRGAQDLRPRLGEEPSRSLIGDLNTEWTFRPEWMTRFVDRLPGVRTTAPSELRVQAEVGGSYPNPNTKNEVFIDDMEGVRDAVSLSMDFQRWRHASVPSRMSGTLVTPFIAIPTQRNAEVHWYSPFAVVKERDLKPTLTVTDPQTAQNNRQVLALSVPRRPANANPSPRTGDSLWVGLTYVLDQVGLDLSKAQFIELWVNDFNDYHTGMYQPRIRGDRVRLHVDLGVLSEDQMRSPDRPPNRRLDSEDLLPRDNQLVVSDRQNEDTGLDNLLDAAERDSVPVPRDLVTADPSDPEGDNFGEPVPGEEIDPARHRRVNGTEGNKRILPYPDTEDLNLNNNLDVQEDYLEYTIDLGDAAHPYLETDVQRDFPGSGVAQNNGWRRYRIPITDSLRVQFGTPDLSLTRHVRVWLEGLQEADAPGMPLIELGTLDIVGSRWRLAEEATAAPADTGARATLNAVNTVDNADVYRAPFDPGQTSSGGRAIARREQSLALEFKQLLPGDTLEAFKSFSIDEDYSRYGTLEWYVAGYDIPGYDATRDTTLYYFLRFASDENGRNFYEYRARMPRNSPRARPDSLVWQRVRLPLTDLSSLKLSSASTSGDTIVAGGQRLPGDTLIVFGRPSFTRLRRISFGVVNGTGREFPQGQLWFNELRAIDVAKDAGIAQRVLVNGRFSNLVSYNVSWNTRDADFLSVGDARGTGTTTGQLGVDTQVDLHRFFEATGILLPFSYNYASNNSKPRFTVGDDVVRTGTDATANQTKGESRSWRLSYSRTWSDRTPWWLRHTIGGLSAGVTQASSDNRSPTSVDRSSQTALNVNYSIAPRRGGWQLPLTKWRFHLLPERVFSNYTMNQREGEQFDRLRDSARTEVLRNRVSGRSAAINFGMDNRPFDVLHHRVEGVRNLTLGDQVRTDRIGGLDLGKVVSIRQTLDATGGLNKGPWLRPRFTWNANYSQNNGPELSPDLSVRALTNGQGVSMRWELPFDSFTGTTGAGGRATPVARDSTGRAVSPPVPLWRQLVARLGNISTDASIGKSSSYSRLFGSPDFAYLFGFRRNPGVGSRMEAGFGNQASRSFDWRTQAQTRVPIAFGAVARTSFELNSRRSEQNDVGRRTDQTRFPDVTLEYGQVAQAIRLDRILTSPQLRTAYNRSRSTEFKTNSADAQTISTSSQWQPLVGLTGDLKNGTRIQLSLERRNTLRESFQLGRSIATDRNTDVNLSVSRSYTKGQKVNVLGRESTVRSSVNLGLTAAYSKHSGETQEFDDRGVSRGVRFPINEDRLSTNANGSYGFSSNVTGNVSLGFGQTRDLERDIIRRNLRVELRAQFTF